MDNALLPCSSKLAAEIKPANICVRGSRVYIEVSCVPHVNGHAFYIAQSGPGSSSLHTTEEIVVNLIVSLVAHIQMSCWSGHPSGVVVALRQQVVVISVVVSHRKGGWGRSASSLAPEV